MKLRKGLKPMAAALALAVLAGFAQAQSGGGADAGSSLTDLLMQAVMNNNAEELRMVLRSFGRANVNARINGTTPLIAAASYTGGWIWGVELLLDAGADPNITDANGRTALMAAAKNGGDQRIVDTLILRSNVNAKDRDGCTALMYAIANGSRGVIDTLMVQRGIDPTIRAAGGPYAGQDALTIAVQKEDSRAVSVLLGLPGVAATINSPDRNGMSAFAYALESGDERIFGNFLSTGHIDFSQEIGDTGLPLLLWAISSRISASCIVELIYATSSYPHVEVNDITDRRGRNAWYYATLMNNPAVLRALREVGVRKNEGE